MGRDYLQYLLDLSLGQLRIAFILYKRGKLFLENPSESFFSKG
jgi:hypothetical protein